MVKHQDTDNNIFYSGVQSTIISHYHIIAFYVLVYTPAHLYTCTCIYNLQVQIWTQKPQPFKQGQQEEKFSPKHSK